MDWMAQGRERSRLGRILIEKRLISEEQLIAAISEQGKSGRRLGEILADMRLITEAQVLGAIRRQRNLRMAAALATALLGPLHAWAAVTAAPAAAVSAARTLGERRELSDEELGSIVAQGEKEGGAQRVPGELARVLGPLGPLLAADTEVRDVNYDPANSRAVVNKDGSVTLRLPSTIGEISFRNIRVAGDADGPSFGSISLRDIDLTGTTITVKPR